jgi:Copper/zinc superoxide dismutase (SODC)
MAVIVVILVTNQGKKNPVNPFGKQHGAPCDSDRHVGDLGNFKTDGQGNSQGSIEDSQVKLIGEHSVLGVCPKFPPRQFHTLIPPHLPWFFSQFDFLANERGNTDSIPSASEIKRL